MGKGLLVRLYNFLFEDDESSGTKMAGSNPLSDKDYEDKLLTFYCPVCQSEVVGEQTVVYDRGYDRRKVVCSVCQKGFMGQRNIVVDDPRLTQEERVSKTVIIAGRTYYW